MSMLQRMRKVSNTRIDLIGYFTCEHCDEQLYWNNIVKVSLLVSIMKHYTGNNQ